MPVAHVYHCVTHLVGGSGVRDVERRGNGENLLDQLCDLFDPRGGAARGTIVGVSAHVIY